MSTNFNPLARYYKSYMCGVGGAGGGGPGGGGGGGAQVRGTKP